MTEIHHFGEITLLIAPIENDEGLSRREAERKAVNQMLNEAVGEGVAVGHHKSGAPFLIGCDLFISISHSRHYAAIALSLSDKIGVDIEEPRSQLRKVAHRVMSQRELSVYGDDDDLLLQAWTLKEALYKAAQTPGLDFRRDIILPETPGATLAEAAGRKFEVRALISRPDFALALVSSS